MAKRYLAVIFDFFGTLTHAFHRGPGHEQVARVLGADPILFTALLDSSFTARARGAYGGIESTLLWMANQLGRTPTAGQISEAARVRLAAIKGDISVREEAVPTLLRLRARGLSIGMISDCTDELPMMWPELPFAHLFDATVFSVDEGHTKPDRRLFELACRELGVAPVDCLYVGDGGGHELTGAGHAGMTAVRLVAPDLITHLSFNTDTHWTGPSILDLTDVLDLVDEVPATGPYWADERADRRLVGAGRG
jgi:putative hydrolase of the HAD superfamily